MRYENEYYEYVAACEAEQEKPVSYASFEADMDDSAMSHQDEFAYFHSLRNA